MKTLLLVENDTDPLDVFGTLLRHRGYRVAPALSVAEGPRLSSESRPDPIVVEMTVPAVGGLSAADNLATDPATRGIPIVALSFHTDDLYRRRAVATGPLFMEKPRLSLTPASVVGEPLAERSG